MHNLANKTITEVIRTELQNDIIHGVFRAGQKLSIKLLMQHYSSGSSPIREALSRLTATGMIVSEGQKGFYTPEISIQDFHDLALAIESLASQVFAETRYIESDAVQYLKTTLDRLEHDNEKSPHNWVKHIQQFYLTLASSHPSSYLRNCHLQLSQHVERYQHQILIFYRNPQLKLRPIREKQIVQALESNDWYTANKLAVKAQQKLMETIKAQLQQMHSGNKATNDATPELSQQKWQSA